jgi:hypothetical protein
LPLLSYGIGDLSARPNYGRVIHISFLFVWREERAGGTLLFPREIEASLRESAHILGCLMSGKFDKAASEGGARHGCTPKTN